MAAMLGPVINTQFTRSPLVACAERAATVTDLDKDRIVKSDMERVFRPLAGRSPAPEYEPAFERDARTRRRSAGVRGGFRWLSFAAPVLLVLFVAAFAIRFGITEPAAYRSAREPSAEPPAQAVAPRSTAVAAPAAAPRPVPVAEEVARADRTRPLTAEAPPREAGPELPMQEPEIATRATRPTFGRRTERPTARAAGPAVVASAASERRISRAPRRSASSDEPCAPGSEEDRCIYQDVMHADARLRAAYARATRNGVPTSDLAGVRRRWSRAQRVSLDAPDEAIRRYDRLADELHYLSDAE